MNDKINDRPTTTPEQPDMGIATPVSVADYLAEQPAPEAEQPAEPPASAEEPARTGETQEAPGTLDGSAPAEEVTSAPAPVGGSQVPPRQGRQARGKARQARGKARAKPAAKPAKQAKAKPATTKPAKAKPAPKPSKAAREVVAAVGAVTGVKAKILDLIQRPNGATEREVCEILGWKKAGATIGRAIKAAPFKVRKERDGGRTRYYAL